jgi:hypothetical protein
VDGSWRRTNADRSKATSGKPFPLTLLKTKLDSTHPQTATTSSGSTRVSTTEW